MNDKDLVKISTINVLKERSDEAKADYVNSVYSNRKIAFKYREKNGEKVKMQISDDNGNLLPWDGTYEYEFDERGIPISPTPAEFAEQCKMLNEKWKLLFELAYKMGEDKDKIKGSVFIINGGKRKGMKLEAKKSTLNQIAEELCGNVKHLGRLYAGALGVKSRTPGQPSVRVFGPKFVEFMREAAAAERFGKKDPLDENSEPLFPTNEREMRKQFPALFGYIEGYERHAFVTNGMFQKLMSIYFTHNGMKYDNNTKDTIEIKVKRETIHVPIKGKFHVDGDEIMRKYFDDIFETLSNRQASVERKTKKDKEGNVEEYENVKFFRRDAFGMEQVMVIQAQIAADVDPEVKRRFESVKGVKGKNKDSYTSEYANILTHVCEEDKVVTDVRKYYKETADKEKKERDKLQRASVRKSKPQKKKEKIALHQRMMQEQEARTRRNEEEEEEEEREEHESGEDEE